MAEAKWEISRLKAFERKISIGNSLICSDIWHKYHEWYFKIVLHNLEQFWNITSGIYAKYHVQFMLLIVYTTTWKIQSSNAMCLFLSTCFASSASKLVLKFLFSAQLVQTLNQVDLLFSVFWFSEFSFSSWISCLQNLEIFPPFLRNSCDEMI